MHHAEESPVQFAEGAIVAAARGAYHVPQFACLVRDDRLLLPASGARRGYLKLVRA
jgi:hypothetical protein